MAGDLGSKGKAAKPPVLPSANSGRPEGKNSGGSSFTGTRPSPTKGRAKGPR